MKRQIFIAIVTLVVLAGSLVAAGATLRDRDEALRGYVDPTRNADLPFRIPRLGVNADLTQYTKDELAQQLEWMRQAKVTWVRQQFRWRELEPQPGIYHWEQVDVLVEPFARNADLKLVAVLTESPEWARETVRPLPVSVNPTAPPDDPAKFANFVRAFAERYGDVIDYYQVWDEPNLSSGWGDENPSAAEYLALLQAAYHVVHGADARATVIAAGLAPTTEQGPANVSDIRFLNDLYALGLSDYMDAAAAKPYGFNASPEDRTVREDTLNFSRIIALREVMVRYGDAEKALWAADWGWNSLPSDWEGAPSIWGDVSDGERVSYTLSALDRAEREWAWLGGMILHTWQPLAEEDDPQWGFALVDSSDNPSLLLDALREGRSGLQGAVDGVYTVLNDYANYSGVWTFSDFGADIGWVQDSSLQFNFQGSDLALIVREDDYAAFLYVTVDNQPANALPHDASGSTMLNLSSDSYLPETNLVPVARGLHAGEHSLRLIADRGWDRWALVGFAVSSGSLSEPYDRQINVALVTAAVSALAFVMTAARLEWSLLRARAARLWLRLGGIGQILVSVVTSLALLAAMLLTWSDAVPSLFRREPVQFALALVSAGLLYVEPPLVVMLLALVVLFLIILSRPELGLLLTLLYAPFFLFPVELYRFAFPMSELLILLTTVAGAVRGLAAWGRAHHSEAPFSILSARQHLHPLDYCLMAWIALGVVSLLWAEQRGQALTELRTLMIEPAFFYLLFRLVIRERMAMLRMTDALLVAGLLVAVIGLVQFARGDAIITAEAGTLRLASVYGSPNNVGLFLGRCIPFLLAFVVLSLDTKRRAAAAVVLLVVLAALILSQSAGALLLGVPVSAAVVLLLVFGKRGLPGIAGLAALGAAAFALALQSARFSRLLDFTEGTSFFRIRVWQSAIQMLLDHPITGIGLDQFLYLYRGRYILPDAWQEPNLSHPHNFLLDFWLRLGLAGLIVFFLIQVIFWRHALGFYRSIRKTDPLLLALAVGMMGSMTNLLAHGLVDNSVFVHDLVYVFVFLLALCANLSGLRSRDGT